MENQRIGKIGENKAYEYLINKGYLVLERNYKKKFGEIDIIARAPDRTLVFIEVKAFLIKEFSGLKPEDNFTTHKYIKVNRICEFYVAAHPELIDEEKGWQIDLIAIEASQTREGIKGVLRHYKNV